jgi:hypothetical protein
MAARDTPRSSAASVCEIKSCSMLVSSSELFFFFAIFLQISLDKWKEDAAIHLNKGKARDASLNFQEKIKTMFRLEETEISKAVDRCKEMHPTVRVIAYGEYTVTGSRAGSLYTVKCYRDSEGFKTVDCSCKTSDGVACKHGMAAVALRLYLATVQMIIRRRAARLARTRK